MKKATLILKLICLAFAAITLFSLTGCFSLPDDYDDYDFNDYYDEDEDDDEDDDEDEDEDEDENDDEDEDDEDDEDIENLNNEHPDHNNHQPGHPDHHNEYHYEYNNYYENNNNHDDNYNFEYNNEDTYNNTLNHNSNNDNNSNSSNNTTENQDNSNSDSSDNNNSENCNNETSNTNGYDYYYDKNVMPSCTSETQVPSGYIGIYTIDDLKNADKNPKKSYILMCDLDLSGIKDWNGITNKKTFDGNGHTISNLTSTTSGLFEYANDVSDLYLTNVNIVCKTNNEENKLGAICNRSSGTLSGCYVSGTVKYYINKSINSNTYVGGICGYGYSFSFCKNNATVYVESYLENDTFAGGISGYAYYINDCINYGNVKLEATTKDGISTNTSEPYMNNNIGAGGICGCCDTKITIDACKNEGDVLCNVTAGGILATTHSVTDLTVKNSSNTGRVLVYGHSDCTWVCAAGGIVGRSNAYFMHSKNLIENCYNSGEVGVDKKYNADFTRPYIGAIIGYEGSESGIDTDITVKNCTIRKTYPESGTRAMPSGVDAIYELVISLTDSEMHDIGNFNFTNKSAWRNSPSTNSPYPFCIHNYF